MQLESIACGDSHSLAVQITAHRCLNYNNKIKSVTKYSHGGNPKIINLPSKLKVLSLSPSWFSLTNPLSIYIAEVIIALLSHKKEIAILGGPIYLGDWDSPILLKIKNFHLKFNFQVKLNQ